MPSNSPDRPSTLHHHLQPYLVAIRPWSSRLLIVNDSLPSPRLCPVAVFFASPSRHPDRSSTRSSRDHLRSRFSSSPTSISKSSSRSIHPHPPLGDTRDHGAFDTTARHRCPCRPRHCDTGPWPRTCYRAFHMVPSRPWPSSLSRPPPCPASRRACRANGQQGLWRDRSAGD